jgi:cytochrome c-type biogenesis protein CcmH
MANSINSLKKQLTQLKELHDAGALTAPQYGESKAALERRLLDAVLEVPTDTGSASKAPQREAARRPSKGLYAVLAVSVVVIAAAGYWWARAPVQAGLAITPPGADDATSGKSHATNFDQISAMTDRLAARMKDQPQDAEGWAMLARSYSVLGKHPDALQAYEKAVALRKDDATLLADYADALAIKNNRSLAGEAMKQIDAALKIDPRNLKALSLAGTHAFDKKDYATAAKFWGQVVQFGPADNALVQQITPSLAEARDLAGLPADGGVPESGASVSKGVSPTVSGTVTLSENLRAKAQPEDTVFVFARAAEGSRMPLAIVRKQVRDLPYQFTLDDSTSMSPASKLSTSAKLIVGARISKSGNALPQPGDLSGQSGVVSLGISGLQLEIKDIVKP